MKKMVNLFTLLVFLWTSFLTPVSYAQATEMWNSDISANEEFQNNVSNDITETNNSVDENYDDSDQSTSETSDDSPSLQMDNRELNIALQALPQRSWTMFIPWEEFNLRLKSLANYGNYYYYTDEYDGNIIKFKKSETPAPDGFTTIWLATDDSEYEIIAWYDNWTIYYYTDADTIYLNPDSGLMFQSMEALMSIDTDKWDTSTVTDMRGMFANCYNLKELDVSNWNTSNTNYMGGMFFECSSLKELDVSKWNTSKVTNMGGMFFECSSLKELDVSKWNTSKVTDMWSWEYSNHGYSYGMFASCSSLKELDVSKWNTSKVTNMGDMFASCSSLKELDLSEWDTSTVTDMRGMFASDVALTNLDVSKWNTSKVTDMGSMFLGCSSLKELDLSEWNTSNVTNMRNMFANDVALTNLDVSKWNTSKVTNTEGMFSFCVNLTELDLSNWDTSNVKNMNQMFANDSLETIYVSDKFVTNNVSEWYDMFRDNLSLIWWNWTKYDPNYIDYGYANIDTDQTPWYFTNISWNTVIVRFFTNGWLEVDPQVVSKWGIIESVTTSKENAVFKWWYTDEWLTRSFKTSTLVNSNLKLYAKWECAQWYYDNKWQCIDENKKIEHKWWIIKITDGEKTIYIKDRNQWATESRWSTLIHKLLNPVLQKVKEWQSLPLGWLYNYVANELSNIAGTEMFTLWELLEHYDNDGVKFIKDIKSKYEEWKYLDSFGNYYYWWNDVGVSYSELWLWDLTWSINFINGDAPDGANNILIENLTNLFAANVPESAIERWFTGWKIWLEWEWWTEWNSNPCDASKWEYLPTLQDWVDLMQVWWNINWRRVVRTELWEGSWEVYVFGSWLDNLINWTLNPMELLELLNLEMSDDLMIPWAWWVIKAEDAASLVKIILMMQWASEDVIDSITDYVIDDLWVKYVYLPLLSPLRVASDSWDAVWIYIWEAGIISVTNDIWHYANNFAAPVRCFVDESAWPKDEEHKENNYSGWWWKWGSNSKSDTEADTHWSADEQKDTDNDKKTEEKQNSTQNDTQNEDKSETTAPQDYQWNKWSNFASNEFQKAYNFAHSYGITTKKSVESAKMNSSLTRIQMAKMLSNYAMNVMWKHPDISKWVIKFDDVTNKMNKEYDNWVNLAYQLWIMWQNMPWNKFRPKDEVTRAEFITALSRLLYSTSDWEYKWTWKYYIHHMQKLKREWIITNENPNMTEKRWYVMIMLMRSAK